MGNLTLLIDEPGASLTRTGERFVVRYPDGTTERVGAKAVGQVLLGKSVTVDSGVLSLAATQAVALTALPGPRGEGPCHLVAVQSRPSERRLRQYACVLNEKTRLQLARVVVESKVCSQVAALKHYGRDSSVTLSLRAVKTAVSVSRLLGLEGATTAKYFEQWRELWPPEWGFERRTRRPPRDPVNGLMSLGYALALQAVIERILHHGLDPTFGFLHAPRGQRRSLGLDVMEPARAAIDRWLYGLVTSGLISRSDFVEKDGLPTLDKGGRQRFYQAWFEQGPRPCRDAGGTVVEHASCGDRSRSDGTNGQRLGSPKDGY